MSDHRVRCKMCGQLTSRVFTVYATPAVAPGVNVPGAKAKPWSVCRSCYELLGEDEESGEVEE